MEENQVSVYQTVSDEERNRVVEQLYFLVPQIAKRLGGKFKRCLGSFVSADASTEPSYPDLLSVGGEKLLMLADEYGNGLTVDLAAKSIENAMRDVLRAQRRTDKAEVREEECDELRLDPGESLKGRLEKLACDPSEVDTLLEIQDAKEKLLNPREQQVVRLLEEGYKQAEIAQQMGITQPRVCQIAASAGKKLRGFRE